jgi:hypothetical protein
MAPRILIASTLFLALAIAGCGDGDDVATRKQQAAETLEKAVAERQADGAPETPGAAPANAIIAPVAETMDAGGYTYVKVEKDGEAVWAAGPQTALEVGDVVTIATVMPMPNFHSAALERDFELLYFVNGFTPDAGGHGGHGGGMGGMGGMGAMGGTPAGEHPAPSPAADVDLSGIARAEGGHTVAEIHAAGPELAGETVRVRGRVVKYLPGIMGRNWLHVRDGSGAEGTNDLTVTTEGFAQVGDLVLIEGALSTDKDFGAGYRYDVIVEDAAVTKE